jgi:hypothetical protein
MNLGRLSKDAVLFQAGLRINNSLADDMVKIAVAPFGFTEEKLNQGKALLTEAETLYESQQKEYGDVDGAQNQLVELREQAHKVYMSMLVIARIALKNNVQATTTLELGGERASTISGWLKQTRNFYRALLANSDWKEAMMAYGQAEEDLNHALQAVDAVNLAAEQVKKEMGDAQNATGKRDMKFEELIEWVRDYEKVARIALANQPQLLEKLGIVVKS